MAPEWLTKWEYAHRGLHGEGCPENSIAAAKAAIEAGMGVECDVQRSADGEVMVFHDWEADRLTNGAGLVQELSADQIASLSLQKTDQNPPTLTAFLDCIAGRVPVLIEVKSKPGYDVEPSCQRVREVLRSYSGDVAVMSFDPRVSMWLRENAPQITCGLVMREDRYGYTQSAAERGEALRAADPDFLAYHVEALPNPLVAGLRAQGLPILTWTVNSPETRAVGLANADALVSEGEGTG